jgi:hypothetical protein
VYVFLNASVTSIRSYDTDLHLIAAVYFEESRNYMHTQKHIYSPRK